MTIPDMTKENLERYVSHGCHPGGFLYAVLTNDLIGSVANADKFNREALVETVAYIYKALPHTCWGSKEKVTAWMQKKAEERALQNSEE